MYDFCHVTCAQPKFLLFKGCCCGVTTDRAKLFILIKTSTSSNELPYTACQDQQNAGKSKPINYGGQYLALAILAKYLS